MSDALAAKNLRAVRFTKEEMRDRKTPDFRVFRDSEFAFYCEVKEVAQDDWAEGGRPDPIFNRLVADIHTSVKQFKSANSDRRDPNVLAFVNNDNRCDYLDLLAVTTGQFFAADGSNDPIYRQFSEGRIRDEKFQVDLYLWFDSFKADQFLFNVFDARHLDRLCGYLSVDPLSLEILGDRP
ncbi:MAG TPA: hypothetical protein VMW19_09145 [Myxococcota bacterium]|nr:hypothetical protein [Myxococcota bacterium]